ncbi:MAG: 7TM-DISM domain-containing protein [Crocinitomicaceae bacterium]
MKIILWISFFFSVLQLFANSKPPVQVHASYYLDKESSCSLNEISSKHFQNLPENKNLNIGYNENLAAWLKIDLQNPTSSTQNFWLVLDNNRLDSIQLFDNKQIAILGDRTTSYLPFLSYPAFEISLPGKSTKHYILRLKKGISFMDFSFHLETDVSIQQRSNRFFFLLSLTLGLILFLLIFNSILFWIARQKIYLIYVSYSILSTIYILIATGFAKFILLPHFLYFSEGLIYFGSIWFLILFIFLSFFLNLKENDPKLYRIILILTLITTLYIVSSVFFYAFGLLNWLKILSVLNYANFLLLIVLIFVASIRHLKVNRSNAIYVLLSFIPHFVWSISIILKAFGIFSKELHINWLVLLSFYDILLFGFVLVRFYFETFQKNRVLNEQIILQKETEIQTIVNTQITERQNIANLIHDQFGSAIGHIMQVSEKDQNPKLKELLVDFSTNIREVSHQIMPKALEDGALVHAIENQLTILNKTLTNCTIEFESYDFPTFISVDKAQNLYLIFLELINNARKHGKASNIRIEFFGYEQSLVLQCTDNGLGFDKTNFEYGFGLASIDRRIKQFNGEFYIESEINIGTLVQIEIPKILTSQY